MTALARARGGAAVVALLLLAAMVWLGTTRIAPLVPDGRLLQSRVLGYDTADLFAFAKGIRDGGATQLYRTTLIYLDTAFIAAVSLLTVLLVWPWRWLGALLALTYAGLDLAENMRLLAEVERYGGGWVVYPPLPGTPSAAGFLTSAKFLALAAIGAAAAARGLSRR